MTRPTRRRPVHLTDERSLLEAWLEFHRATLLVKCEGLSDEQVLLRPIPTSLLSLHGLVRHIAEAERNWFGRILAGDLDGPDIWPESKEVGDTLVVPAGSEWTSDLKTWQRECEVSRAHAAQLSLDFQSKWRGRPVTLRSIYHQMIQEYARHNGHADLLRELIDGTTGL